MTLRQKNNSKKSLSKPEKKKMTERLPFVIAEKAINKIKSRLPEFSEPSRPASAYKEDVKEAQAYLAIIEELTGCESQFSWKRLKQVYASAEELIKNAASDLITAVYVPPGNEPMAVLTWTQDLEAKRRNFRLTKNLFNFTINRLHIRKKLKTGK